MYFTITFRFDIITHLRYFHTTHGLRNNPPYPGRCIYSILLMHVHPGIPLKHTKGLYCLSPQVLGTPLNSSPKTHLGAASCYRLRPRSDAVSESAALLRSSHRLSSPRRNPLFERDVRSNRRSNSLYLAATLGGLRCLCGQRLFNTLVPTLLDDN